MMLVVMDALKRTHTVFTTLGRFFLSSMLEMTSPIPQIATNG